ncbi:hypothetical protein [Candidatus Tisiphia endosymbiont of Micropterix aruncella]|uniref:hypothetical protein n=1 Tax=Candidatus Tisiphia endosymbiont of Micropterix aruncella TaxID=3066271 RepID=UPI003AA812D0
MLTTLYQVSALTTTDYFGAITFTFWFRLDCFAVYALLLSLPSAAQDSLYGGASYSFHNRTFTHKINAPYLDAHTTSIRDKD